MCVYRCTLRLVAIVAWMTMGHTQTPNSTTTPGTSVPPSPPSDTLSRPIGSNLDVPSDACVNVVDRELLATYNMTVDCGQVATTSGETYVVQSELDLPVYIRSRRQESQATILRPTYCLRKVVLNSDVTPTTMFVYEQNHSWTPLTNSIPSVDVGYEDSISLGADPRFHTYDEDGYRTFDADFPNFDYRCVRSCTFPHLSDATPRSVPPCMFVRNSHVISLQPSDEPLTSDGVASTCPVLAWLIGLETRIKKQDLTISTEGCMTLDFTPPTIDRTDSTDLTDSDDAGKGQRRRARTLLQQQVQGSSGSGAQCVIVDGTFSPADYTVNLRPALEGPSMTTDDLDPTSDTFGTLADLLQTISDVHTSNVYLHKSIDELQASAQVTGCLLQSAWQHLDAVHDDLHKSYRRVEEYNVITQARMRNYNSDLIDMYGTMSSLSNFMFAQVKHRDDQLRILTIARKRREVYSRQMLLHDLSRRGLSRRLRQLRYLQILRDISGDDHCNAFLRLPDPKLTSWDVNFIIPGAHPPEPVQYNVTELRSTLTSNTNSPRLFRVLLHDTSQSEITRCPVSPQQAYVSLQSLFDAGCVEELFDGDTFRTYTSVRSVDLCTSRITASLSDSIVNVRSTTNVNIADYIVVGDETFCRPADLQQQQQQSPSTDGGRRSRVLQTGIYPVTLIGNATIAYLNGVCRYEMDCLRRHNQNLEATSGTFGRQGQSAVKTTYRIHSLNRFPLEPSDVVSADEVDAVLHDFDTKMEQNWTYLVPDDLTPGKFVRLRAHAATDAYDTGRWAFAEYKCRSSYSLTEPTHPDCATNNYSVPMYTYRKSLGDFYLDTLNHRGVVREEGTSRTTPRVTLFLWDDIYMQTSTTYKHDLEGYDALSPVVYRALINDEVYLSKTGATLRDPARKDTKAMYDAGASESYRHMTMVCPKHYEDHIGANNCANMQCDGFVTIFNNGKPSYLRRCLRVTQAVYDHNYDDVPTYRYTTEFRTDFTSMQADTIYGPSSADSKSDMLKGSKRWAYSGYLRSCPAGYGPVPNSFDQNGITYNVNAVGGWYVRKCKKMGKGAYEQIGGVTNSTRWVNGTLTQAEYGKLSAAVQEISGQNSPATLNDLASEYRDCIQTSSGPGQSCLGFDEFGVGASHRNDKVCMLWAGCGFEPGRDGWRFDGTNLTVCNRSADVEALDSRENADRKSTWTSRRIFPYRYLSYAARQVVIPGIRMVQVAARASDGKAIHSDYVPQDLVCKLNTTRLPGDLLEFDRGTLASRDGNVDLCFREHRDQTDWVPLVSMVSLTDDHEFRDPDPTRRSVLSLKHYDCHYATDWDTGVVETKVGAAEEGQEEVVFHFTYAFDVERAPSPPPASPSGGGDSGGDTGGDTTQFPDPVRGQFHQVRPIFAEAMAHDAAVSRHLEATQLDMVETAVADGVISLEGNSTYHTTSTPVQQLQLRNTLFLRAHATKEAVITHYFTKYFYAATSTDSRDASQTNYTRRVRAGPGFWVRHRASERHRHFRTCMLTPEHCRQPNAPPTEPDSGAKEQFIPSGEGLTFGSGLFMDPLLIGHSLFVHWLSQTPTDDILQRIPHLAGYVDWILDKFPDRLPDMCLGPPVRGVTLFRSDRPIHFEVSRSGANVTNTSQTVSGRSPPTILPVIPYLSIPERYTVTQYAHPALSLLRRTHAIREFYYGNVRTGWFLDFVPNLVREWFVVQGNQTYTTSATKTPGVLKVNHLQGLVATLGQNLSQIIGNGAEAVSWVHVLQVPPILQSSYRWSSRSLANETGDVYWGGDMINATPIRTILDVFRGNIETWERVQTDLDAAVQNSTRNWTAENEQLVQKTRFYTQNINDRQNQIDKLQKKAQKDLEQVDQDMQKILDDLKNKDVQDLDGKSCELWNLLCGVRLFLFTKNNKFDLLKALSPSCWTCRVLQTGETVDLQAEEFRAFDRLRIGPCILLLIIVLYHVILTMCAILTVYVIMSIRAKNIEDESNSRKHFLLTSVDSFISHFRMKFDIAVDAAGEVTLYAHKRATKKNT